MTADTDLDFAFSLDPDEPLLPGEEFHGVLAELRAADRMPMVRFLGSEMGLITRFADLDTAFREDEAFPAGPTYARTIEPCQGFTFESCDGPEHHALRDLSTRGLRSRPVARFRDASLVDLAHEVIDRFAGEPEVDLVTEFTDVFPFLTFAQRLGLPVEQEGTYRRWAFDVLGYPGDNERGLAAAAALTELVQPVLAERRAEPTDDLLSSMVSAERGGRRLNDEEILAHVRALFSAGAVTSHHGLGNTLYALLIDPEAVRRLRVDRGLIPSAVDEMLRWEPPVALLPRLAPMDVELAGRSVSAGSMVLMGIASANRDERVHAEPDRFDIERAPTRVLTFGFGSHHCPGSHLAKAQINVGVQALLDRFDRLELLDPVAARPSGTVMRGPRELRVDLQ